MDENSDGATEKPAGGDLFGALIERWWEDHFPGSAVARETQAWNTAHAAKETLKRLLAQAHGKFSKGSV
jgi:hypothetical protein